MSRQNSHDRYKPTHYCKHTWGRGVSLCNRWPIARNKLSYDWNKVDCKMCIKVKPVET